MLELGVIEKSVYPYLSPVVFVPNKHGSVRFCIEFRKLNKVTEFDAEPMPNMEEVINTMSGHTFLPKWIAVRDTSRWVFWITVSI